MPRHLMRPQPILVATFDSPSGGPHPIEGGVTRFVGWCFSQDGPIEALWLEVGGRLHPITHAMDRPDVAEAFPHVSGAHHSGFAGKVPLPPGVHHVALVARVGLQGTARYRMPAPIVVGRPAFASMRYALARISGRISSGRGLPSFSELPALLRGLGEDRRTLQAGMAVATPSDVQLPARVEPYDGWLAVNRWCQRDAKRLASRLANQPGLPLISIVTPVFKPDLKLFLETAASVTSQVFQRWEWCLADDASGNTELSAALQRLAASDPRIRFETRQENGHISRASNTAAGLARGDYLAFLDHDDLLSPDALGEVALRLAAHPDTDVLYTDDDKIDESGRRFSPHFKPEWSPESLLSQMYLSHLFVVRRSLFEQVGGFRPGLDGAQDHDLALRVTELAYRVEHVPRVLYHWRAVEGSTSVSGDAKPYSFPAALRAVDDAFVRRGINATSERPPWAVLAGASLVRHRFADRARRVSILIPSRNNHVLLGRCLASLRRTSYENYDITIVDDHSDDPGTLEFLEHCAVRVIRRAENRKSFNFSALCNHAARVAEGEFIVFLNDDIEVSSEDWLSQLVGFGAMPGVGAVGARLLFPNRTVQHAGVLHGFNQGSLALAFRGLNWNDPGYLAAARVCRNYGAVTAACMLTRRDVFLESGGFDEIDFPVSFNDIDYCYRLSERGLRCVYAAEAELIHHEGASRGVGSSPFEVAAFRKKHSGRAERHYSPHLSRSNERFDVQPRRLAERTGSPVKALMVGHALDFTGAPLCQFEMAVALQRAELVTPQVVSFRDGPLRRLYERSGIEVVLCEGHDGVSNEEEFLRRRDNLAGVIEASRCEVVYGNTLQTFLAIDAARTAGRPALWNIRESEPWQTYYDELPRAVRARAFSCFSYPYRVIFVSSGSRAVFEELNTHLNFAVVHDGLVADAWKHVPDSGTRARARTALTIDEFDTCLLLVGTVCERKGQEDLVRAMSQLAADVAPHVRIFIVGDRPGAYSSQLSALIKELPPERRRRIHLIQETDDVATYFHAADMFVCTSRIESYPRVTLEAMACGLPVISTPVFGLAEQLVSGANATFYSPGDVAGLASAVEALTRDRPLRVDMALESPKVLAGLKSFDEMLEDYATQFREAAALC